MRVIFSSHFATSVGLSFASPCMKCHELRFRFVGTGFVFSRVFWFLEFGVVVFALVVFEASVV